MLCRYCDATEVHPLKLATHLRAEHGLVVGPGIAARDHTRAVDEPVEAL